jgi:hypothetical protein
MSESTNTTRASLLKRLALLASGAVGVGVAARTAGGAEPAAAPAPTATPRPASTQLTLHGRDWRLSRPGVAAGTLPAPNDPVVPAGRIVDVRGGDLGIFRASALPGLPAFHLHTFDLADGTILGIGANKLDDGSYAIVGGTGRYAGASGTYTARQRPRDLGGDGTADFHLNLNAWEA